MSAETDGEVTKYLIDKNRDYAQVLEERDADGNLIVDYVYGDDLIRQERGGVLSYYHYDGQLSVRQLSDADGDVSDDYVYDAFGVLIGQSGDTVNDYLYTGEQFDEAVDGYYLRARYYSPDGGRFVSSDPWQGKMSEPVTLHKYLYANANPVMCNDPSGKMTISEDAARRRIEKDLMSITNNYIKPLLHFYDKAMSVKDIVDGFRQVLLMSINGGFFEQCVSNISWNNNPTSRFRRLLKDAPIDLGENIPAIIGKGLHRWIPGYIKARKNHKLENYLLFAPVIGGVNYMVTFKTGAKINDIPVKVAFGGGNESKWGSLFGVGLTLKGRRQLFRQDWHSPNEGHGGVGGKSSELAYWATKRGFNYHVYGWDYTF
ncbi:Rhs family protein [Desulfonema ishimotonii]|uniref:Rhs family protein n=1 Tax=Desulfonema ishimotonii TaxID=45657 RepID=A0A401FVN2_9BACT|nr:RHS repeat-associated core domain-containing protein [Desulfonema ishimotonii]GBC61018.1 Rhs family protein [Desulfonema ishimotonii]